MTADRKNASRTGASGPPRRPVLDVPDALEHTAEICADIDGRALAVFLDYDGTVSPIVNDPARAILSERMRTILWELSTRWPVAIVSGRDRADVESRVGIPALYYAGSHGFDISGPGGMRWQHEAGAAVAAHLDRAERALAAAIGDVPGLRLDRKRFALAVHVRLVDERALPRVEAAVDEAVAAHPSLRKTAGKKVFELRPTVSWDKGEAVMWLLDVFRSRAVEPLPIYLGDDVTDEDAFAALEGIGLRILVGAPDHVTAADYRLRDIDEVEQLLSELVAVGG